MNETSLLYRHVSPIQVQNGRVNSLVFTPMPKDKKRLSVDDGEHLSPESSYRRFTANGCSSCGILSVTVEECNRINLQVFPDALESNPDHAVIDFSECSSSSQIKKAAKKLKKYADERNWVYLPILWFGLLSFASYSI